MWAAGGRLPHPRLQLTALLAPLVPFFLTRLAFFTCFVISDQKSLTLAFSHNFPFLFFKVSSGIHIFFWWGWTGTKFQIHKGLH